MTHREKIQRFLAEVEERGVGAIEAAPPLYRLCWMLRIPIRPPAFQGLWFNAALFGAFFGLVWGAVLWWITWTFWDSPSWFVPAVMVLAAVVFGMAMAVYHRRIAKRLGLTSWDRYAEGPPAPAAPAAPAA